MSGAASGNVINEKVEQGRPQERPLRDRAPDGPVGGEAVVEADGEGSIMEVGVKEPNERRGNIEVD